MENDSQNDYLLIDMELAVFFFTGAGVFILYDGILSVSAGVCVHGRKLLTEPVSNVIRLISDHMTALYNRNMVLLWYILK